MRADSPERLAASLTCDILVAEPIGDPRADVAWIGSDDQIHVMGPEETDAYADRDSETGILIVAIDRWTRPVEAVLRAADDTDRFTIAVCNVRHEERGELGVLERVREVVDVTLLAVSSRQSTADSVGDAETTTSGARPFQSRVAVGGALDVVSILRKPGHINLDLADLQTVLTDGAVALLARGTCSFETDGPKAIVRRIIETLPPSVDTAGKSDALVSVVGGPDMRIDDAIAAIRAVREDLGTLEEVIWGVATDDTLTGRLTVDVIIDDITYQPPLSAGDPCRRCGAGLVEYTFDEQTTLACEACGFVDLSLSLGE